MLAAHAEQPSPVLETPSEIHVKTNGTPACFSVILRNAGRAAFEYECRANCPSEAFKAESRSVERQKASCWGPTTLSTCRVDAGESKTYEVCVKIRKGRPNSDGVSIVFDPPGGKHRLSKRITVVLAN